MADAPPLLDASVVTNIVAFLEANNGALPLGKVTRQFRGVKKAQLSEFFVVTVGANPNDPVISINELSGQQLAEASARAATQPAATGPPATAPSQAPVEVPPLDGGRVLEITSLLEANAGSLSLGKLARQFRGVKKAQLEKHFFVEVEEGAPDFVVSLNPRGGGGEGLPPRAAVLPGELPPGAVPEFGAGPTTVGGGFPLAATAGQPQVPPLQPVAVQRVALALSDNGGAMSLGKLTRTFPGVKKAQLMKHFAVVHDSTQGPVVQLPGGVLAAPRRARVPLGRRGPGLGNNGGLLIRPHVGFRAPPFRGPPFGVGPAPMALPSRGTQPADPASIEQLTPARLAEVTSFIQNNEGSVSLGRLTRQFRGLKKVQLIPHFNICQDEGEPDLIVSMHNAATGTGARKRSRTEAFGEKVPGEEPPALDAGRVAEMTAFLEASGGSLPLGKMTREFRGVKKAQLAQHFTMTVADNPQDPVVSIGEPNLAALSDLSALGPSQQKRARRATKEEPQDVEVPPLDTLRLAEITALLVTNGGPVPLGKLTRQFPGVKKAQLEQHLTLSWEADQRDFVVGLSEVSNNVVT